MALAENEPSSARKLTILYQSNDYVVVDKPADVLINSSTSGHDQQGVTTVETLLKSAMPHLHDSSLCFGFRFVHRLDFSTSGVLCLALNKDAAAEATRAFAARKTAKYYVALVSGHVEVHGRLSIVDVAVGSDSRPDYVHRMCLEGEPHCAAHSIRPAVTQVLVLQRGFYDDHDQQIRRPASKLLLKALTGRRHQLRLHCRHIGHAIVGDYTYTDRADTAPHRMFLHSLRLVLPTRAEPLDVSTDDPFMDVWTPTETFHALDDPLVYQQFDEHP